MRDCVQEILNDGLVAIVRGVGPREMLDTVWALYRGGIRCVEVTFDQTRIEDTLESIGLVSKELGDRLLVGAGTVMTVKQAELARECGARYMISPNVDVEVIKKTKEMGCGSLPGALTPSEIASAVHAGADIIKLFPAGIMGPAYIKDIRGPLGYIPYFAVGGITLDNMGEFFQSGVRGFGIGGSLVNLNDVRNRDFQSIEDRAGTYVKYWNSLKAQS